MLDLLAHQKKSFINNMLSGQQNKIVNVNTKTNNDNKTHEDN